MNELKGTMDETSHLILHHTPKAEIKNGITIISKGEGVFIFDREGKEYIDLMSGITRPVHLGYGNKELAQAIYNQVVELAYFTPIMFANEPAIKLAQVLLEPYYFYWTIDFFSRFDGIFVSIILTTVIDNNYLARDTFADKKTGGQLNILFNLVALFVSGDNYT